MSKPDAADASRAGGGSDRLEAGEHRPTAIPPSRLTLGDVARPEADLVRDPETQLGRADGRNRFGPLGEQFDRHSPFWIGMSGGLGIGVAYVVAIAVSSSRQVLLLMALALVIAIGLDPVVGLLRRMGVPRWLGVLMVSLAVLAVVGVFLALAIPPLVSETNRLLNLAPHYVQSLQDKSSLLGRLNRQYHVERDLRQALSHGGVRVVGSGLIGAGKKVLGVAEGTFIVTALVIYLLVDMPRVKRAIYRMVPRSRRARTAVLVDEVFARVGGYVLGNVLTSVIAGLGTLVWLEIFSVPYPAVLSVFVGLMDLIPLVGSTIAGFIVALVALTVSLPVAVATAIFYVVYRNAEDYLITPRVMKRTVRVPGLVTVIAVVIGGSLLGIIGALIAIPVAATVQLVVEEVVYPRMELS